MDINVEQIIEKLNTFTKERVIIAIDGRCASGKTTLAELLKGALDCNVFHMDDFFLRQEQRTEQRLSEPGGNVDRERFESEVLAPLLRGEDFSYRKYSCRLGGFSETINVQNRRINIIEGAYSCHPDLRSCYDLKIFLSTDYRTQLERIRARNGSSQVF
ncbi:MAG: uridine kinase, partial [Huintestinicola sp.]